MRVLPLTVGVSCLAAQAAAENFDFTGKWKVVPATEATTCCWPEGDITIAQKGDKAEVTGTWAGSEACTALDLNGKTLDSKENTVAGKKLPIGIKAKDDADQGITLTKTEDAEVKATYSSTVHTDCTATFELVKEAPAEQPKDTDWSGHWKLEVDSTSAQTCCWPKPDVTVYQKDTKATTSGEWADTDACKKFGVQNQKWTSRNKDIAGKDLALVFSLGGQIIAATLTRTDATTAVYKNVLQADCKATFKLDAEKTKANPVTAPVEVNNWAGKWKVKPAAESAGCCWPADPVTVTQKDGDVTDSVGHWAKSEGCTKFGIAEQAWEAKNQIVDPDNKLVLLFKLGEHVQLATLVKNGESANYQNLNTPECHATFELEKETPAQPNPSKPDPTDPKTPAQPNPSKPDPTDPKTPAQPNPSKPDPTDPKTPVQPTPSDPIHQKPGAEPSNPTNPGKPQQKKPFKFPPWGYAVIVVVVIILILLGYFLYRRHQAAKLSQSLRTQNESLLPH